MNGDIGWASLWRSEDWWACWFGSSLFLLSLTGALGQVPRPRVWDANPLNAVPVNMLLPVLALMVGITALYSIGVKSMKGDPLAFAPAFFAIFAMGFLSQLIARQRTINAYGFEYVFWALLIGIIIRNAAGLPKMLEKAVMTELYIKTGLVLLGAEVLFGVMLNLGLYGLVLAWGVTPVVLYSIYLLGTRKLKMDRSFALLIAAATSVCGVSAAIAMAAASKAKREHLTITISMSLIFTAIMLLGMPAVIRATGMDQLVGGAWIGGTIDSSGAVVAAGELVSKEAMEVAVVIKMIQNAMIGVLAFIVALIWVVKIEKEPGARPRLLDVWYRFPKFIIGFIGLSLVTSFALTPVMGEAVVGDLLKVTAGLRTYFFSFAFVSIGLETGFMELAKNIEGRNPINLYIIGQLFNVVLTYLFAWILFGVLMPK